MGETAEHRQQGEGMKDATRLADNIANTIERSTIYVRDNWKTVVIILWMLGVTITLIQMKTSLKQTSSENQVANLKLSADDMRYSVEELEVQVEAMRESVSKMESSVSEMQSSVNRINTQLRNNNH